MGRASRHAGPASRRGQRVKILAIDAASEDSGQLLFDLQAALKGGVQLLHGGIDQIQSRAVGRFFVSIPSGDVAAARQFLISCLARVEVLGHV